MEHKRPKQVERIKDYLQRYGSITQLEALKDLGIMRLASRITEMRKDGEGIKGEWVKVKDRWGHPCEVKRYFYKEAQ
jgi:hypothetical protein